MFLIVQNVEQKSVFISIFQSRSTPLNIGVFFSSLWPASRINYLFTPTILQILVVLIDAERNNTYFQQVFSPKGKQNSPSKPKNAVPLATFLEILNNIILSSSTIQRELLGSRSKPFYILGTWFFGTKPSTAFPSSVLGPPCKNWPS